MKYATLALLLLPLATGCGSKCAECGDTGSDADLYEKRASEREIQRVECATRAMECANAGGTPEECVPEGGC